MRFLHQYKMEVSRVLETVRKGASLKYCKVQYSLLSYGECAKLKTTKRGTDFVEINLLFIYS